MSIIKYIYLKFNFYEINCYKYQAFFPKHSGIHNYYKKYAKGEGDDTKLMSVAEKSQCF